MSRRGGFQGMPGNMNNLMKQAQRMQRQLEEQQKSLQEKEFKGTAGGGVVEVTMTGGKTVKGVRIDPEAVDPEDVETLEDLIVAAFNDVMKKIDDEQADAMSKMGGMGGLGGLSL